MSHIKVKGIVITFHFLFTRFGELLGAIVCRFLVEISELLPGQFSICLSQERAKTIIIIRMVKKKIPIHFADFWVSRVRKMVPMENHVFMPWTSGSVNHAPKMDGLEKIMGFKHFY